jgi:transcriptional regulator with PAS, ATPase and Fis domain
MATAIDLFGDETRDPAALRDRYAREIIGEDPTLLLELETALSAADTDATILVHGESGTGKELVAGAVHRASPRADKPFVALNCAAVPENLIEAELFGHVRGAFTGAVSTREGHIQSAHGGTLFLDEIGDLPLAAQAKLLRVLQERTITPVGSDRPVHVDVRIVAATHKDLEQMVERGEFRADLWFRLCVIQIELPRLHDRGDDILRLARHFIRVINARTQRAVEGLDASAERALLEHGWPGNVRELENVIQRAVILKRAGKLTAADLRLRAGRGASSPRLAVVPTPTADVPARAESQPTPPARLPGESTADLNLRLALEEVERRYIGLALERSQGNRTEAAALLGLNRTTLVEKMRKIAG